MKHLTSDRGWYGLLTLLVVVNLLLWWIVALALVQAASWEPSWTSSALFLSSLAAQFVAIPVGVLGCFAAVWTARVGQKGRAKALAWLSGSALLCGLLGWIIAQGVYKALGP